MKTSLICNSKSAKNNKRTVNGINKSASLLHFSNEESIINQNVKMVNAIYLYKDIEISYENWRIGA